ncbi:MAG: nucleoside triphosphate pyrophosphohydrolase [Planctomycetes bacterium]|nr:nucleoside triphosphate pyrophosphohydrolase [Planctomycetota bacterium]
MPPTASLDRLISVMQSLLGPGGCPWDREQTPDTIRAFLLEETHEVLAALDARDADGVKEELGDVLYQVVFLSELFHRKGAFDLAAVIDGIADKLVRRHPWVFGNEKVASPEEALRNWERLKSLEREKKKASVLDGVPDTLPALAKAFRLSSKAARVGFEWPDIGGVLAKLDEEIGEFKEVVKGGDVSRIEDELGDVLFTLANVAREMKIDPEGALRRTNDKFVKRFRYVEAKLRERGKQPETSTLEEMDALWNEAKKAK